VEAWKRIIVSTVIVEYIANCCGYGKVLVRNSAVIKINTIYLLGIITAVIRRIIHGIRKLLIRRFIQGELYRKCVEICCCAVDLFLRKHFTQVIHVFFLLRVVLHFFDRFFWLNICLGRIFKRILHFFFRGFQNLFFRSRHIFQKFIHQGLRRSSLLRSFCNGLTNGAFRLCSLWFHSVRNAFLLRFHIGLFCGRIFRMILRTFC